MKDDSAEILFQSFLQKALVGISGMDRDVHSLKMSTQHFLCRSQRRPPSKVPQRMVLERLSWPVTYPNQSSCRKRFLWTHKEVDLVPHPVVGLVLKVGDAEKFLLTLGFESLDPLLQSLQAGSMFHSRRGGWKEQG